MRCSRRGTGAVDPVAEKAETGYQRRFSASTSRLGSQTTGFWSKGNIMPTTMTQNQTMNAVQIHAFGGPEVLQYEEVPMPQPKANELLVRVHATGVNPVDWKIREGYFSGALPLIMGIDFSGV